MAMGKYHIRSPQTERKARNLADNGAPLKVIAKALGMCVRSLYTHYPDVVQYAHAVYKDSLEGNYKNRTLEPDCPPSLLMHASEVHLGYRRTVPIDPDRGKAVTELTDDALELLVDRLRRKQATPALIEERPACDDEPLVEGVGGEG